MANPPSTSGPSRPARPVSGETSSTAGLWARTVGKGPALVLAHGFTQTGLVWGSMDDDLAVDHRITALDMPGHGRSGRVRSTVAEGAAQVGAAGGRAAYLGYSMGARYCLHLALARPELVEALILVSGTAGIDDAVERSERRRADEALAEQLDPSDPVRTPAVPVATFVRRWLENPMFAGVGAEANGLDERLSNTGPGLASSLRLAGTGTQRPRWDDLHRLDMPVLVVTGGDDSKFTSLGRRLTAAIGPNSRHVVVTGAGHAPHLQRPGDVAAAVRAHLTT